MRRWTDDQRDVMSRLYPAGGVVAVQQALDRTRDAIHRQAVRQGLTYVGPEAVEREQAADAVSVALRQWVVPGMGIAEPNLGTPVGVLSPSLGLVLGVVA